MEVPGNSQNYELPKKTSKKLVIKVNDKRNDESSDKKKEEEPKPAIVEKVPESESMVVNESKV